MNTQTKSPAYLLVEEMQARHKAEGDRIRNLWNVVHTLPDNFPATFMMQGGYKAQQSVSARVPDREVAIAWARELKPVPLVRYKQDNLHGVVPIDSLERGFMPRCQTWLGIIEPWYYQLSHKGWPTPWSLHFWADRTPVYGADKTPIRTRFSIDIESDKAAIVPRKGNPYGFIALNEPEHKDVIKHANGLWKYVFTPA